MLKRIVIFVLALTFVLGGTLAAIFYIRGFRIDRGKGSISRTGLLVVDSTPDGAKVFLDDRLTSAADTTITFLTPKKYKLKLVKEGFTDWEKEIEIKADLTTEVEAILFPKIPELKPLTFTGVSQPLLSPDGQKLIYAIPTGEKAGLWALNMADRPLGIGGGNHQLVKNSPAHDFSTSKVAFSPDGKFLWVQVQIAGRKDESSKRNYLLDSDRLNDSLADVTATIASTLSSWQQEINLEEGEKLKRIRKDLPQIASASAGILEQTLRLATASAKLEPQEVKHNPDNLIWSPDETKFFVKKNGKDYAAGATLYRVRDPNPLKETPATFEIPPADNIFWYPSSEHLVLVEKDKISIIEYDGTNKVTVFTGSFEDNFVFPWSNGSSLVILTSLNQESGTPPNLYALRLR